MSDVDAQQCAAEEIRGADEARKREWDELLGRFAGVTPGIQIEDAGRTVLINDIRSMHAWAAHRQDLIARCGVLSLPVHLVEACITAEAYPVRVAIGAQGILKPVAS